MGRSCSRKLPPSVWTIITQHNQPLFFPSLHLLNQILLGEVKAVQQVSLQEVSLLSTHADIEPVEQLRGDHGEDGSKYWYYQNEDCRIITNMVRFKLTSGVGCQDHLQHFLLPCVEHHVVVEDESVPVDGDRHRNSSVHHHHQPVKSKPCHADKVILHHSPAQYFILKMQHAIYNIIDL